MGSFTSQVQDLRRLLRQPVLFIWACFIMAIPFYVVRGGLPQPGDALIFILVPLALVPWNGRLEPAKRRIFRPLLQFTIWVCLVDIAWAVILWRGQKNMLFPLYYLYNAAIFLVVLVLHRKYGEAFLRLTVQVVFASVVVQVLASFFRTGGGSRHAVFFDNPNQLGYYALISACVIALTTKRLKIKLLWSAIGLTFCAYLAVLSASRSALAGIGLLVVLLMFSNPRVIIVATLAATTLTLLGSSVETSLDAIEARITETRNPNMTFWEQRGYDRIWNNKEYLLIGASEGNNQRFADSTAIGSAEIHSSAGTVLFSYGLIGTALFVAFLWRVLRGTTRRMQIMVAPVLFYWVAHQGLRFTMLWILLGVFALLKQSATKTAAKPARPPQPLGVAA